MEQFKQFLAQQEAQKAALASAETTEEAPAESEEKPGAQAGTQLFYDQPT